MKVVNIFTITLLLSCILAQAPVQKKAKNADICAMDAVLHMSKAGKEMAFKLTKTEISGIASEYHEHIPGEGFETQIITETVVIHQSPESEGGVKISSDNDVLVKEINKELKYLNELSHHVENLERSGEEIGNLGGIGKKIRRG